MAKISTYVIDGTIVDGDKVIGSDANNSMVTKNYTVGDLTAYMAVQIGNNFLVPYNNATQNVDLGLYDLSANNLEISGTLSADGSTGLPGQVLISQGSGSPAIWGYNIGSQNLLNVLNNGNTANKNISLSTLTASAIIDVQNTYGKAAIYLNNITDSLNSVWLADKLHLESSSHRVDYQPNKIRYMFGSNYVDIVPNNYTNQTFFLPTYGGYIPISINGNFADASGNITVPTGGGVQSVVGGTDISVDNTDPLNPIVNYTGVTSTPDLQAVTNVGNATTSSLISYIPYSGSPIGQSELNNSQIITFSYSGTSASLFPDGSLSLENGTYQALLKSTNVLTGAVTLEFPDKATGSYTIATTDDVITPDLQTVTNAGSTTTNSMSVVNAGIGSSDISQTYFLTQNLVTNAYTAIGHNGYIEFGNGSTSSFIKNTNATAGNLTTLQIPDKATGDYTIATTSDLTGGTVTSISTSGLISGGTITTSGTISTSMNTNRLVGRSTALVGEMEEISIGTGLALSGGTLSATSSGGILHATASGTDTYTATISGVTAYSDGDAYLIRFTNGNTDASTLNINGLGAVTLYRNNDGALLGGDIWAGGEMLCIYNSTLVGFQCIGTSPNSLFAYVTNADSVAITKGQPVYAFGGTGNRMTVKLAYNTSDATSAKTVGLVYSTSIAANQKGIIIMQGLLDGLSILPTSTWADGDTVYLGSTAGAITPTKQYAPNHLVYLGVVTTASNGAAGRLYVRVQNGYELDELHNVQAQTPSLKDTLYYDNSVSPAQWKTASIATILGYTPLSSSAIGVTVQGYNASTTTLGNTTTGSGTTLVLSTSPTFTTSIITPTVTGVTGALAFTNTAQSSGAITDYTFTSAANTAQTASTEVNAVNFNLSATVQHATGALTTQRDFLIQARTHSFVGASTITSAGTLVVSAAPIAGTNATITNKYSIWSQSGNVFFQDANSNDFRFGAGLGGNTTLSTIWLKQGASPSSTNYSMAYLNSTTYINAPTSGTVAISIASIDMLTITNSVLTITDAKNIAVGTSTGTKIGTTTSQKIGFWNKTPIVQPTTTITGATRVGGAGTTVTTTDTYGGYTIAQIAAALINTGILA